MITICAIVRDELDLLDWYNHHVSIGVDNFVIFNNGKNIEPMENTVIIDWQGDGNVQMQAYQHYIDNIMDKSDGWTCFIDADEYLLPIKSEPLKTILKDYERPGISGLNVSWRIFGSSGHITRPSGKVMDNYKYIIPKDHYESTHTKTIARNQFVKSPGHNPHYFNYRSGTSVSEDYRKVISAFTKHSSNRLSLNHYCLKSLEDWELKISKPRADSSTQPRKTMLDFYRLDKLATEKNS